MAVKRLKLLTFDRRYLVRDIHWCGSKETSDGINYDECPERTECNAQAPFWAAASRTVSHQGRPPNRGNVAERNRAKTRAIHT